MSVALLTNSSSVPVSLNPNLFFSSLRGTTLTLDTLNVGTIRAGQVLLGDDALPDIYMFGQVPSLKILGFPPAAPTANGAYPTVSLPNSTGADNVDGVITRQSNLLSPLRYKRALGLRYRSETMIPHTPGAHQQAMELSQLFLPRA